MAPYTEMVQSDKRIPDSEKLQFFSEEQYADPAFPFQPFEGGRRMGWVKTISVINGSEVYVPAQLVLLGYTVNHHEGEPWLSSAVTTGTAAHTSGADWSAEAERRTEAADAKYSAPA
jgi:ribosomal protein S12 methylthiotransferase accessory factor YcaO